MVIIKNTTVEFNEENHYGGNADKGQIWETGFRSGCCRTLKNDWTSAPWINNSCIIKLEVL